MGMKTVVLSIVAALAASSSVGSETIKLPAPDGDSGVTVTQALKARHSERAFADKELSPELLSGVLWAANGFNRPDKRTNATGLNKQEIMVYAIMKSGAYRYDAKGNALVKVCDEDLRPAIAGHQPNGRRFSTTVMNFYSFDDDGKIFKDVVATGIAGILKGIGAIK